MEKNKHYIGIDWAQARMAVARITNDKTMGVQETPTDIRELKLYLKQLKGWKAATFEESTGSQWLYTELRDCVDHLVVCDPVRNRFLSEGPKTDKIDALKLAQLLKGGLLKPVYHSGDQFIELRGLVSGYEDVIQSGVRFKNQRAAVLRGQGKKKEEKEFHEGWWGFVLEGLERQIGSYEEEKDRYKKAFGRLAIKHKSIRDLSSIPGIGIVGAVKIIATVVDPSRFPNRNAFLSYCGLVNHKRMSGGQFYGKRKPRCSRRLKSVFKTAAFSIAVKLTEGPLKAYYLDLREKQGFPKYQARHALARRIAVLALGVLKNGKRFKSLKEKGCKGFIAA